MKLISLGVESKIYTTHIVTDDIDDSSTSSDIICSVTLLSGKRVLLGPAQVGVAISGFAQTQAVAKTGSEEPEQYLFLVRKRPKHISDIVQAKPSKCSDCDSDGHHYVTGTFSSNTVTGYCRQHMQLW